MPLVQNNVSLVTAVLPTASAQNVLTALTEDEHVNALVSKARGTLLREHWWEAWVPSISPAKTKVQMLVPHQDLDRTVSLIVEHGRLHQQASGAVFSLKSSNVHLGSKCRLISPDKVSPKHDGGHSLQSNLHVIFCVVSHTASERISKVAINAGAHGPVVYYVDGRGLRDRLGWLRITRDTEYEVLMIIANDANVDGIFNAITKAGELHLPGRGMMYRLEIDRGMFNLPSRQSSRHSGANMQQIISAIDHLNGHTHWRDQSALKLADKTKTTLSSQQSPTDSYLRDHQCSTIVVDGDNAQLAIELLLDHGAPGLNYSRAKLLSEDEENHLAHAAVNQEYCVMRCVVNQSTAARISAGIENEAEAAGLNDLCVLTHAVPLVSTYNPGRVDHRTRPVFDEKLQTQSATIT